MQRHWTNPSRRASAHAAKPDAGTTAADTEQTDFAIHATKTTINHVNVTTDADARGAPAHLNAYTRERRGN